MQHFAVQVNSSEDELVGDYAWTLKMGPRGCPETSVTNYQSTLRNSSEERRSNLHRGWSLQSRQIGTCEEMWIHWGIHQLFIDLKKACDSVNRVVLCYILVEYDTATHATG
jgi:hypothetical protein